jgi:hypothetical protein
MHSGDGDHHPGTCLKTSDMVVIGGIYPLGPRLGQFMETL